jgi:Zn-dependent metalloprotease
LPPPPQPLPGQQTIAVTLPTSYLGDVTLRVIPRGNNNYELIQDTSGVHVRPLILKVVDSRQIPNFNPDNPPTANELATMPPKVVNMETCQRHKLTLQALRPKTNRTASEEVAFYQALVELGAIDLLFLKGQYFSFLKEFCGVENVSNNSSMFLAAVSNIPSFDNAFAFYNSFYCGDGKTQFYPLNTADVVSHEISHLLVAQIAGLVYQGHSGALNESMSDCIALFFERWLYMKFNEDADQTNNLLGSWNFTIGEVCGRRLRTMRNFKNPLDAQQPCAAYYRGEAWGDPNSPVDFGGVHGNSGVSNKCFYEVIQAVGWDLAGNLVFATLKKLQPHASFLDFRDALKASASEFNCLPQILLCLNTVGLTDQAISDWTPIM